MISRRLAQKILVKMAGPASQLSMRRNTAAIVHQDTVGNVVRWVSQKRWKIVGVVKIQ